MGCLQPGAAAERGCQGVPPQINTRDGYGSEDTNLAARFTRCDIHFIPGRLDTTVVVW